MEQKTLTGPAEQPEAFVLWHRPPGGPWTKMATASSRDAAWQALREERLSLGESTVLALGVHPRKRYHSATYT
jgi:hypothetical protein